MNKIGIWIDFGNICKGYNTVYLDRDNTDRETASCMKKVMVWFKPFFSEFLETFDYNIYRMNHDMALKLEDIVRKRFFFYSLEKEIIDQTFVFQKNAPTYGSLGEWKNENVESLIVKNNDEGEGIYLYFDENSDIHKWLLDNLKHISWDEIAFEG